MKQYVCKTSILAVCFVMLTCAENENSDESVMLVNNPIIVTVYDSDYSLALTRKIKLDDSTVIITSIGSLVGESDQVVYNRLITKQQRKDVREFFQSFPLDSLRSYYEPPDSIIIDDGDQKLFVFEIGGLKKEVQTSNYYQEDLGLLVNLLNSLIPNEYNIVYEDNG